jgi:hypothetical protein
MAESRKIVVSKEKLAEWLEPRPMSEEDALPWDVVEVVEVWYTEGRQGRGYYLWVSIWRERKREYPSVDQPGKVVAITSTMIGVGSSAARELLEVVPRFNQKRAAYWAGAVLQDPRLQAMRRKVREAQGLWKEPAEAEVTVEG